MGARFGQHFLTSERAIGTILDRFSPKAGDCVVEIGPGRGALTKRLVEHVCAIAAIELDRDLAKDLSHSLGFSLVNDTGEDRTSERGSEHGGSSGRAPVCVGLLEPVKQEEGPPDPVRPGRRFMLQSDALAARYSSLATLLELPSGQRLRVLANLPYGVATALIRRMVAERDLIEDAVLMVQREVADRLLAGPGSKDYGLLSVILALTTRTQRVLNLGPGAFSPQPKVRSTVVAIQFERPLQGFQHTDAQLYTLLKVAFGERRKKMASNLARGFGTSRDEAAERMAACGGDPAARAEQIAPVVFARLAASLTGPSVTFPSQDILE